MQILAAIFDLDGTIVDSEAAWRKAYSNVLKSFGIETERGFSGDFGISIKDSWEALISKYNIKTSKTLDELEVLTYKEYEKFIPDVNLKDGAVEFITGLKDGGIQTVLATSSNWEVTDKILRNLNIEYLFEDLTTGEEVLSQKPDPEMYIKAAEKLGLEPEVCLVIEDSHAGVIAAKDAGMKVIAIDPTGENKDLEEADLVVGEFSEITPKAVDQL